MTSHNPDDIVLPPTMTSMPTGTWMLSGTSIIVNGKESLREYSSINLETLKVINLDFLHSVEIAGGGESSIVFFFTFYGCSCASAFLFLLNGNCKRERYSTRQILDSVCWGRNSF